MKHHHNPRYSAPHSANSLPGVAHTRNQTMYHLTKLWRTWVSVFLIALLAGATHADTSRQDFTAARQVWDTAGIHDYQFTLAQHCFCPAEEAIRIVVRQDAVASARYTPSGQSVNSDRLNSLPSLSAIFQKIEDGYARNAASIQLSLNPEYGYPERVFIDYTTMIADEELIYLIQDFSR